MAHQISHTDPCFATFDASPLKVEIPLCGPCSRLTDHPSGPDPAPKFPTDAR